MYFPFFIVKRPNSAKRIQRILHRYAALFDLDSGVPLLEVAVLLALFTCNCFCYEKRETGGARGTGVSNRTLRAK